MVPEVCKPQPRGGRGLAVKRRGTRGLLAEAAVAGKGRPPTRRFASSLSAPVPLLLPSGYGPNPAPEGGGLSPGRRGFPEAFHRALSTQHLSRLAGEQSRP